MSVRIDKPGGDGEPAVVWLERPEARNALTPAMLGEVEGGVERLIVEGCPIVLAGKGECFCAGFDLKMCRDDAGALADLLRGLSRVVGVMKGAPVPVVLAAHGAAVAGACALFGGADHVVADAGAKIGYPVVRLGLSPAVSAPYLSAQVAAGVMRRLMLDHALVDGAEARRVGLVHEVVARAEDVVPAAIASARALAAKPRGAYAAMKRILNDVEAVHQACAATAPPEGWAARGLGVSLASAEQDETRERIAGLFHR